MKKEKYERDQFSLEECKTKINIIPSKEKGEGYATAYLNVHLPDGRWLVFSIDEDHRVPIYKES